MMSTQLCKDHTGSGWPLRQDNKWGRSCVLCITVLLGLAVGMGWVNAEDWPHWRGPSRNGISTETGLNWNWTQESPKTLWKASVGKGFSSISVAGGRAYTIGNRDNTDTVYCFEAKTGKELWKHSYPCALDPKSFEGGTLSTPAIDGNRVYTMGKFGQFLCLDAQTGKVLWSRKFEPPVLTKTDYHVWWGFAGSPVISGNSIILPVGKAGVALNKLTGDELWNNGPGHSGYSTPTLFNLASRSSFAFISGHEIVAADVEKGQVHWILPWKTTWDQNASDVVVSDLKMFVSTGHEVGCALFDLSKEKPTEIWRNKNMRTYLSTCILWKGFLYGFDDKRLSCLDWNTGQVKWTVASLGLGSLIMADGKLIALTEKGSLMGVDANSEAYRLIAEAQIIGGRCWSAPALSEGRLFVRNAAGDVVCLELKPPPSRN